MSETANPLPAAPASEEKSNNVASEAKDTTITNDVQNSKPELNNQEQKASVLSTPSGRRRKRTSELADASLVIETPGGNENRRTTRSQTRGTPTPVVAAPTPAKKVALANNGTPGTKGRRGRPPKNAAVSGAISQETTELVTQEEVVKAEAKPESKTTVSPNANTEPKSDEKSTLGVDLTDGGSISKQEPEPTNAQNANKVAEVAISENDVKPTETCKVVPPSITKEVNSKSEKTQDKEPEKEQEKAVLQPVSEKPAANDASLIKSVSDSTVNNTSGGGGGVGSTPSEASTKSAVNNSEAAQTAPKSEA